MRATHLLLAGLALAGGCDKPAGNGASPSPNAPGVHEQPSTAVSDANLAKQPTQGEADAYVPGEPDEAVNRRGTTKTPDTVTNEEDAVIKGDGGLATTDASKPGYRVAAGGPGDKLEGKDAKAIFKAAPGIKLKGDAEFEIVEGGVKVEVEVKNAPQGTKGIHIHENPDCSNIPGKSMGEHFAPDVKQHGIPSGGAPHHLGDLGNITIDKDGEGELEFVVKGANLKDHDPLSLIGRAVVIHEKQDEGSQPSGNSGKPIACAVVKPE